VNEETLDPASPAEWAEFQALAHRMVDEMLAHLATLRDQPAWREMPPDVRRALGSGGPASAGEVPRAGIGADAAYEEFVRNVRPYPNGNIHPRFW